MTHEKHQALRCIHGTGSLEPCQLCALPSYPREKVQYTQPSGLLKNLLHFIMVPTLNEITPLPHRCVHVCVYPRAYTTLDVIFKVAVTSFETVFHWPVVQQAAVSLFPPLTSPSTKTTRGGSGT